MRLAASRSHRSPRMDKVVQAFGLKEEVLRGSVGIKVGLIVEQQCDLYIHLSPRTKQWDTCAPEVILHEAGGRHNRLVRPASALQRGRSAKSQRRGCQQWRLS